MKSIFIGILAFIVGASAQLCQQEGWHYINATNSCYQLICDQQYNTFEAARDYCRSRNGDLASILSQEEDKAINDYLISLDNGKNFTNGNHIRVGLNYANGKWNWIDGHPVGFTHWAKNEGDPEEPDDKETCAPFCTAKAAIRYKKKTENYWYSSFDCSSCMCNLCKAPANPCPGGLILDMKKNKCVSFSTLFCPEGWEVYLPTKKCYLPHYGKYDYNATKFCQDKGGVLASVQDEKHNEFLAGLFKDKVPKDETSWVMIGLTYENSDYSWVDGSNHTYFNWQAGQPDHTGASVGMVVGVARDNPSWEVGKWDDIPDQFGDGVICQKNYNTKRGWASAAAAILPNLPSIWETVKDIGSTIWNWFG